MILDFHEHKNNTVKVNGYAAYLGCGRVKYVCSASPLISFNSSQYVFFHWPLLPFEAVDTQSFCFYWTLGHNAIIEHVQDKKSSIETK